MDRTDAGAGEHGADGLGHHGHVDQHPVALADAEILEHRGKRAHLFQHLRISEGALGAGDRAVVDQRRLVATAGCHMAVKGVVADIADGIREPAAIDAGLGIEHLLRRLGPLQGLRRRAPESGRIRTPAGIGFSVSARSDLGHGRLPFDPLVGDGYCRSPIHDASSHKCVRPWSGKNVSQPDHLVQ